MNKAVNSINLAIGGLKEQLWLLYFCPATFPCRASSICVINKVLSYPQCTRFCSFTDPSDSHYRVSHSINQLISKSYFLAHIHSKREESGGSHMNLSITSGSFSLLKLRTNTFSSEIEKNNANYNFKKIQFSISNVWLCSKITFKCSRSIKIFYLSELYLHVNCIRFSCYTSHVQSLLAISKRLLETEDK